MIKLTAFIEYTHITDSKRIDGEMENPFKDQVFLFNEKTFPFSICSRRKKKSWTQHFPLDFDRKVVCRKKNARNWLECECVRMRGLLHVLIGLWHHLCEKVNNKCCPLVRSPFVVFTVHITNYVEEARLFILSLSLQMAFRNGILVFITSCNFRGHIFATNIHEDLCVDFVNVKVCSKVLNFNAIL